MNHVLEMVPESFFGLFFFQLTALSIAVEGEEVLGPLLIRDATAGPRSVERAIHVLVMLWEKEYWSCSSNSEVKK